MTGCFQKKNVEMGELTMLTKICLNYSVLDVEIAPKWLNLKKWKTSLPFWKRFSGYLKCNNKTHLLIPR